jgi:hypothetical protein
MQNTNKSHFYLFILFIILGALSRLIIETNQVELLKTYA